MKTFKSNTTVKLLLDEARTHLQYADLDLIFVDMAYEEINVALRLSQEKKGYTIKDVLNEMHEYTNWNELTQNQKVCDYLNKVNTFKREIRHN